MGLCVHHQDSSDQYRAIAQPGIAVLNHKNNRHLLLDSAGTLTP